MTVLTIFPRIFDGFTSATLIQRAQEKGFLRIRLVNLRDYATDKHKTTDDTPYGGGPGMVMNIEPIYRALQALDGQATGSRQQAVGKRRTVLLSPRGRQLTQQVAQEYATLETLTLICGRYEGVDQRVADHLCDEELSIGPYVLSGGEVPAMVVIETVSRLLPGVLGNPESLQEESFASPPAVEYPQYTKPATFRGWSVPEVLLSGDHAAIASWRHAHTTRLS